MLKWMEGSVFGWNTRANVMQLLWYKFIFVNWSQRSHPHEIEKSLFLGEPSQLSLWMFRLCKFFVAVICMRLDDDEITIPEHCYRAACGEWLYMALVTRHLSFSTWCSTSYLMPDSTAVHSFFKVMLPYFTVWSSRLSVRNLFFLDSSMSYVKYFSIKLCSGPLLLSSNPSGNAHHGPWIPLTIAVANNRHHLPPSTECLQYHLLLHSVISNAALYISLHHTQHHLLLPLVHLPLLPTWHRCLLLPHMELQLLLTFRVMLLPNKH